MTILQSILRNINVLNLLLTSAVAAAAYIIIVPFVDLDIKVSIPPAKEEAASTTRPAPAPVQFSPADYALISEQNLFHPERKIPPEKAEAKVIPKPEVILYGTLITTDVSVAYIEDKRAPKTTPGRGKRQIAAQKGYNVGGYVLQQIDTDRIVLVKGEDKIVVRMEEGEKRRDAEKTPMVGLPGAGPHGPSAAVSPVSPSPAQKGPITARGRSSTAITPATVPAAPGLNTDASGSKRQGRRNAAQMEVLKRRQAIQMQTP